MTAVSLIKKVEGRSADVSTMDNNRNEIYMSSPLSISSVGLEITSHFELLTSLVMLWKGTCI